MKELAFAILYLHGALLSLPLLQSVGAADPPITTSYCSDYYEDRPEYGSACCAAGSGVACQEISYVILAVSGTLEEGFELRKNMDYRPYGDHSNLGRVNATFLGKALIRGYKSFLDIKNPTWREYKDDEAGLLKTVNPALVPTGCDEHANRYSIYAVDSRQVINALAGEPRFLSIAPDMGLADLTAGGDYTFPDIKALAGAYANNSSLSGIKTPEQHHIAFLTVTSTWLKSTFVANGIIYQDDDNIITDYPESTGIWSTEILNKHGPHDKYPHGCGSNPKGGQVSGVESARDYNACIDAAIRLQEDEFALSSDNHQEQIGLFASFETCSEQGTKSCFPCQKPARYGTTKNTVRFNKVLRACELEALMVQAGLTDDQGRPKFPLQGCSLGFPPLPSDTTPPVCPKTTSLKEEANNQLADKKPATKKLLGLTPSTVLALLIGFSIGLLVA